MSTPNTLTYERWRDLFAAPAVAITVSSGAVTTGRTGDDPSEHDDALDLSTGSYPARWFETIRSGSRDTECVAAAEPVEVALQEELVGAL